MKRASRSSSSDRNSIENIVEMSANEIRGLAKRLQPVQLKQNHYCVVEHICNYQPCA